jgi:hypothetical protein
MKKKISQLVVNSAVLLMSALWSSNHLYSQDIENYKVDKIDSTKNYYLIYVQKDKPYLIVSPKSSIADKSLKKIVIQDQYKLRLFPNNLTRGISRSYSPTISVDGQTIWQTGDKFEVVFTKQLNGLYYLGLKTKNDVNVVQIKGLEKRRRSTGRNKY